MSLLHDSFSDGSPSRRRARIRRVFFASGAVGATMIALAVRHSSPATDALREELESTKGELTLVRAQMARANAILRYSSAYSVTADVATSIFDTSLLEGIDPDLVFRLARLESDFNVNAVSGIGAIGLLQIMPSTARMLEKNVSREQLFNPATNLRVGLKHLRSLLDQYNGDIHLALLAYNRGEDAVWRDLRAGVNPGNGYDQFVMRDYRGNGSIQ